MIWRDLQVVGAVLDAGALVRAADRLGLTHVTVRRSVKRMEDRLGGALFIHAGDGLTPTALAERLRPVLERAAATMDLMARLATSRLDSAAGAVAVAFDAFFVAEYLPAAWAALTAAWPGLVITPVAEAPADWTSLLAGRVDVTMAARPPDDERLDARAAGSLESGLYASRAYVEARGAPVSGLECVAHPWIGPRSPEGLQATLRQLGLPAVEGGFAFTSDHAPNRYAAIRAGFGIGLMPNFLASLEPNLVRVAPDRSARWTFWVATRRDMADVRRIGLVRDFLLRYIADSPLGR